MEHSTESDGFKESTLSADSGCETSPPGVNFSDEANGSGCDQQRSVAVLDKPANSSGISPCDDGNACLPSAVSRATPRCELSTEQRNEFQRDENSTGDDPSHCTTEVAAVPASEEVVHSYNTFPYPFSYYYSNDYGFYYTGQRSPDDFSCYSGSVIPNSQAISSTFENPSAVLYGRTDPNMNYFQWTQLQHLNTDASAVLPRYPVYACAYPSAEANNNNCAFDYVTTNFDSYDPRHASTNSSNSEMQGKPFSIDPSLAHNSWSNFSGSYGYTDGNNSSSGRDRPQSSVTESKQLIHMQRRYSVPNHRVYSRPPLSPPPSELRRRCPSSTQLPTSSHDSEDVRIRSFDTRRHSVPPDQFWFQKNMYSNDRGAASAMHGRRSSIVSQEARRTSLDSNVKNRGWNGDDNANRNARGIQTANVLTSSKHGSTRAKGVMKQYNLYQRLDLPHDYLGKPLLLSTEPRSPRSVEAVWRDHIALLFRNLRETWLISRAPDGFQPSKSWLVYKDLAKVRFYCRSCCDGWTSMYGVVVFYFRRNLLTSHGSSSQRSMDEVQHAAAHRPGRHDEGNRGFSNRSCSRNERHLGDIGTDAHARHESSLRHKTNAACASGQNVEGTVDGSEANGLNNLDVDNNFVKVENDNRNNNTKSEHFVIGMDSKLDSRFGHKETSDLGRRFTRNPDGVRGWGEILYEVAGQKCSRCSPQMFEMPLWYADEAQKVITNLYYAVARRLYGLCTPSPIRTRRLGQPSFHHNAGLCQGCITGLCKAEHCAVSANARSYFPNTRPLCDQPELKRLPGTSHEALWNCKNRKATNRLPANSGVNGNSFASRDLCPIVTNPSLAGDFQSQGEINRWQSTRGRNDFGSYVDQTSPSGYSGLNETPYAIRFPNHKHQYPQNGQSINVPTGGDASIAFNLKQFPTRNETQDFNNKLASCYPPMTLAQVNSASNVSNGQSTCFQPLPLARVDANIYRHVAPHSLISPDSSYSTEMYRAVHPLHFLPSLLPMGCSPLLATRADASQGPAIAGQQRASSHAEPLVHMQADMPPQLLQAAALQPLSQSSGLNPQDPRNSYQCSETSPSTQEESIFLPCPSFASVPFAPANLGTYHL